MELHPKSLNKKLSTSNERIQLKSNDIDMSISNAASNQETEVVAMSKEVPNASFKFIQNITNKIIPATDMSSNNGLSSSVCQIGLFAFSKQNSYVTSPAPDEVIGAAVKLGLTNVIKTSQSMTSLPPTEQLEESGDIIKTKLKMERPYNSLKVSV